MSIPKSPRPQALREMEMEEVSWFLERFAEAFGLTLDGLQRG